MAALVQSGRVKYVFWIICSTSWAWTSTPGMTQPRGLKRRSWRPLADVPIKTICPASSAGSTAPSRTFQAGTYRSGRDLEKWSQISPLASVATGRLPIRTLTIPVWPPNRPSPLAPEDLTMKFFAPWATRSASAERDG